jgi:outer membrane protein
MAENESAFKRLLFTSYLHFHDGGYFMKSLGAALCGILFGVSALAQVPENPPPIQFARPAGTAAPPALVTLQDALDRAQRLDPGLRSAALDAEIAREDLLQSKAALRPSFGYTGQYLGTQGNGLNPSGRYVSNDGVHLYRSWATVHQDLSPNTLTKADYQRAGAAQAVANARVEVSRRGVAVTVTERYYALVVSQRRYATAQQAVQQAQRFLEITQQQERAGEVAHSDAVKADIQTQQQRRHFQEVTLEMENARLNVAVLISPTLDENFTVVDDLDSARSLPPFEELRAMAERENPALRAANELLRQSAFDVRKARNERLPSLGIEGNYGIEANAFKLHSTVAAAPQLGPLPNLGYFFTVTLSVPIFDWGTAGSKVRQAQIKQQQAGTELSLAQRQVIGSLYASYNEAVAARSIVDLARSAADLATESLRLVTLRYQAGESGVLEVVDAQNTLIDARNAYDDAQVRYRLAVAALTSVAGSF